MTSNSVLVFANPIAGKGRGATVVQRLAQRLESERLSPHLLLKRADAIDASELPGDARAAIVVGGDGTLRAVTRRLYEAFGAHIPPLLIVPMGTANLMGLHLGLNWEDAHLADQVIATILKHRVVKLDAARANGDLFLLIAGIGIDGAVVHELDRLRAGPIDLTSYALPAALALGTYRFPPLTVTLDDREIFAQQPAIAFVANIKEYGTRFPILPDARPDDGLLDVCVLPCASPRQVARHFLLAAAGEHLREEGVVYAKGKHVVITSPVPAPMQVDGEAAGHTPVEIDLLPTRIPFLVPASRAGA